MKFSKTPCISSSIRNIQNLCKTSCRLTGRQTNIFQLCSNRNQDIVKRVRSAKKKKWTFFTNQNFFLSTYKN